MANFYWYGGTGNWSDYTNHWSGNSGNSPTDPKANAPTSADNVFFDALSFTGAGQTVTVDAAASFRDMDWTGATNTPTFAVGNPLFVYGNVTFILAMVVTLSAGIAWESPAGILTSNGLDLTSIGYIQVDASLTLGDALTTTRIGIQGGSVDTNDKTVTIANFDTFSAGAKSIDLGASTVNVSALWDMIAGGGTLTFTCGTSTIKLTGTALFTAGAETYNNIELNGTAHTISGSFTCNILALPSGTTQAITVTGGTMVTCTTATLSGDATHLHTIQKSGTGTNPVIRTITLAWDYVGTNGTVTMTALQTATWDFATWA